MDSWDDDYDEDDWEDDRSDEPVKIPNVSCIRDTEKVILCKIGDKQVWIPQSQVHEDSEVWRRGQTGTLVIPSWLAWGRGLLGAAMEGDKGEKKV